MESASNASILSSAYLVPSSQSAYETEDDVASLPSDSASTSDLETLTDDGSDAEAEWQESLEQLELLLTMVLIPFIGKFLGRKCAYWSWARVMEHYYPDVEVKIKSPATFKATGAVEAAATL
ncbi:hypothetical protein N7468_009506 [Penicillium chermesinum]|uniref:Uncharacterized protein n=1 Tax=Penicillium chermesinum TaxID=63820 RepID=A0A9W9NHY9_9EURO|nr:uncharacterized protein N7468_009506 [Penicillium chermesinum]KAJ5220302.1 hypothetical protein N7468_009506 [Penicillium chermesinum]KAJ6157745.1 hypothetical protein N7470_005337 [Penicillium chermesinum]